MEPLPWKRRVCDKLLRGLLCLCGGTVCVLLVFLSLYVFGRGLPELTWQLLSTQRSFLHGTNGILPNILNTLYLIFLSMSMVFPLGTGAAVYLTEYAPSRRFAAAIEFAAELLAGLPSILFGLVGMLFFTRLLGFGYGVLAGSLTLAVMILPTVLRTTQEALKTVPRSYREGALGLGAGKWRTIRTVVLPNAADGIATGCILAAGRVAGESAALLFTAGMGGVLNSFRQSLHSSSGSLSVALYVYANEYADLDAAFAIAAVLMVLTLALNLAAAAMGRRFRRQVRQTSNR